MDSIIINGNKIETSLCIPEEEQQKGLMFKDSIDKPMTFVFSKPSFNKFWMHNTKIPLDIVFCCDNSIVDICEGQPYSLKLVGPNIKTDLVIEFPKGYCKANGIKISDPVNLKTSVNSLAKIFTQKI